MSWPNFPALFLAFAAMTVAGCGAPPPEPPPEPAPEPAAAAESPAVEDAPPPSPVAGRGPLVVFLGDSLTAGLGVAEEEAFPEQLRRLLAARGTEIRVTNAGVSGDTTAGGLTRLDWLLARRPDLLVVALGANDGLRGLSPEQTEQNLRAIVAGARRAGVPVLLAGMLLPPNYGRDYGERFAAIFPRLADELEVPLVPFLLEGVGGRPELNQADGIHPTAAGHRRMAETMLPWVAAELRSG